MALGTIRESLQKVFTLPLIHTAAVAVNEVIVSVGGLVLIAINASLANVKNIYMFAGRVELLKAAPLAVAVGEVVYWDAAAGNITKTSAGNTMCGFCVEAAASADTTITIFLFPDLTNIGTSEIADNACTGAKVAADVLKVATVTLTNSQIKGLAAAQKTLVAAPGANKYIEFISAVLVLNAGTEVLTESDDNLAIRYTDGSGAIVSEAIEATGFIDQAADTITNAIPKKDAIVATASALNKALVLDNTGNGEYAGNATEDATMTVHVAYRVHDFS